jgi:hypothetical protein
MLGAELLKVLFTRLKFSNNDRMYNMLIQLVKQAKASKILMILSTESALISIMNSLKKIIKLENKQNILLRNKLIFQKDRSDMEPSSGSLSVIDTV